MGTAMMLEAHSPADKHGRSRKQRDDHGGRGKAGGGIGKLSKSPRQQNDTAVVLILSLALVSCQRPVNVF